MNLLPSRLARTAGILVAAGLALALSFWGGLDKHGEAVTNDLLIKGAVTFAVTRAAMGGLSVVEEIQLSVAVVSGKPFRVLRPLIDLLDRFSGVLFFAISSLAMLKLLTYLFGTGAFSMLYAAIVIAMVLALLVTPNKGRLMAHWPWRIFLMATVVRFGFVLIVGMNFLVHQVFLAERQQEAMVELEQRAGMVETISSEIISLSAPTIEHDPEAIEPGFFQRWGQRLSPTRMLEELKAKAEAVVDTVIDNTVLLLLQSLVIPLLFFWCVVTLLRKLSP